MKHSVRLAVLAAVSALTVQPVAAQAQAQNCLAEAEVSAIAIYAMPGVVQGVQMRCGPQLASGGFIARSAAEFGARYARLQPTVWPRAKSGLLKIVASKSSAASASRTGNFDSLQMLSSLPDSAVRPLVDAMIVQQITPEIELKQCGRIELVMQALSQVDPEVAGTLLGLVAGLVKLDEPAICEART
jgi:hypothetical protein